MAPRTSASQVKQALKRARGSAFIDYQTIRDPWQLRASTGSFEQSFLFVRRDMAARWMLRVLP
jgi:hypothetical protein